MKDPYENILNAIPEEDLKKILERKGYAKVNEEKKEKKLKPKPMTEKQKIMEEYRQLLLTKYFKSRNPI